MTSSNKNLNKNPYKSLGQENVPTATLPETLRPYSTARELSHGGEEYELGACVGGYDSWQLFILLLSLLNPCCSGSPLKSIWVGKWNLREKWSKKWTVNWFIAIISWSIKVHWNKNKILARYILCEQIQWSKPWHAYGETAENDYDMRKCSMVFAAMECSSKACHDHREAAENHGRAALAWSVEKTVFFHRAYLLDKWFLVTICFDAPRTIACF